MKLNDAELDTLDAQLRERALESLLDWLERGDEYPRSPTRRQINRNDILHECDQSLLAVAVEAHLRDDLCWPTLSARVREIMADYLRDSVFHELMINQLRDQEAEAR
jgi:hypothetical protein